eukprot:634649-Alexandrium_andersonii.AAC.1
MDPSIRLTSDRGNRGTTPGQLRPTGGNHLARSRPSQRWTTAGKPQANPGQPAGIIWPVLALASGGQWRDNPGPTPANRGESFGSF